MYMVQSRGNGGRRFEEEEPGYDDEVRSHALHALASMRARPSPHPMPLSCLRCLSAKCRRLSEAPCGWRQDDRYDVEDREEKPSYEDVDEKPSYEDREEKPSYEDREEKPSYEDEPVAATDGGAASTVAAAE